MNPGVALLALLNAFVVKIGVMVLAGWLTARALRRASPALPDGRDFRLLAAGLACFSVSEIACAIEEYVVQGPSLPWALVHSAASGLAMALIALGLFDAVDGAFLHLLDRRAPCLAAHRVCGTCTLRSAGRCRFHGTLLLAAAAALFAGALPLLAPLDRVTTNPADWALPFEPLNRAFDALLRRPPGAPLPATARFHLPEQALWLEFRFFAWAGMAAAALAAIALAARRTAPGVRALVAAAGVLSFVYLDLAAYALRRDAYLGGLLHETAELLLLLLLAAAWARGRSPAREAPLRHA